MADRIPPRHAGRAPTSTRCRTEVSAMSDREDDIDWLIVQARVRRDSGRRFDLDKVLGELDMTEQGER